jgi:hypothetical protein
VASVDTASVRAPDDAWNRAVAAEQVVFPTPPFPVNMVTVVMSLLNNKDMGQRKNLCFVI